MIADLILQLNSDGTFHDLIHLLLVHASTMPCQITLLRIDLSTYRTDVSLLAMIPIIMPIECVSIRTFKETDITLNTITCRLILSEWLLSTRMEERRTVDENSLSGRSCYRFRLLAYIERSLHIYPDVPPLHVSIKILAACITFRKLDTCIEFRDERKKNASRN